MIEHSPLHRTLPAGTSEALREALARRLAALAGVLAGLTAWMERRRVRNELAVLDDHMLRDMGVTRYDVAQEIRKPFWRA